MVAIHRHQFAVDDDRIVGAADVSGRRIRAVDLDQELAVTTSERLERACRLQLHPIYM